MNYNIDKLLKVLFIIFLNIIFILLSFVLLEYVTYKYEYIRLSKEFKNWNAQMPPNWKYFNFLGYEIRDFKFERFYGYSKKDFNYYNFRTDSGLDYKKPPILLFGCSFTYGYLLNDDETFAAKLSSLTKHPVYNRGCCELGPQYMYFFLNNKEFYETIQEPPEYVIYTFISDHIERLKLPFFNAFGLSPHIRYKLDKNNNLEEDRLPLDFLSFSNFMRKIYINVNSNKHMKNFDYDENFELLNQLFISSYEILKTKYPDVKFIILLYDQHKEVSWILENDSWNELEKNGIQVINTKDLTGRMLNQPKDFASDNLHPSAQAWDLIVPELVKQVGIN